MNVQTEAPEKHPAQNEEWWQRHAQRFLEYTQVTPTGCRVWLGARTFSLLGPMRPQVAAYCLHHRALGVGRNRSVRATCGVDSCVVGAHLEVVVPQGSLVAAARERLEKIVAAVQAGKSYEAVGAQFLISKQRVEQLVRPFLAVCPTCQGLGRLVPAALNGPAPEAVPPKRRGRV